MMGAAGVLTPMEGTNHEKNMDLRYFSDIQSKI